MTVVPLVRHHGPLMSSVRRLIVDTRSVSNKGPNESLFQFSTHMWHEGFQQGPELKDVLHELAVLPACQRRCSALACILREGGAGNPKKHSRESRAGRAFLRS